MVKALIGMVWLGILSVWDIRHRAVPVILLRIGLVLAGGSSLWEWGAGEKNLFGLFLGVIPGVCMLLVAMFTHQAGCADGIVLLTLGLVYGYRANMLLLCGSLMLLSICALVLLCLKKVHKDTRLPFLPFVSVMYALQIWGRLL